MSNNVKKDSKILICSTTSNCSKSFTSYNAFPQKKVMTIDSINSDESAVEPTRGDDVVAISTFLMMNDDVVMDVGHSLLDELLETFETNPHLLHEFDKIAIFVVAGQKSQTDTIDLIFRFKELGFDVSKIRIIFSLVQPRKFNQQFSGTLLALKEIGVIGHAVIPKSQAVEELKVANVKMHELIKLPKNHFRELMKNEKNPEKRMKHASYASLQMLCFGLNDYTKKVVSYIENN